MTPLRKTAPRAYFISDAHLGANLPDVIQRERMLIDFLTRIRDDAGQLFILGDLFDFWVEYRHAIRPDYFNILHALKDLVERGVDIHYIAGNHDFALGTFLTDHIGIHIHPDAWEITTGKRHIYMTHGDGLIAADSGYRLLKRFLRNPVLQTGYRLIHPDIGIGLALFFSGLSRGRNHHRGPRFGPVYYRRAAWSLAEKGFDIILMGHTHHPEIVSHREKTYCNTGDWIKAFSYATLDADILRLWRHRPGRSPVEIPPVRET